MGDSALAWTEGSVVPLVVPARTGERREPPLLAGALLSTIAISSDSREMASRERRHDGSLAVLGDAAARGLPRGGFPVDPRGAWILVGEGMRGGRVCAVPVGLLSGSTVLSKRGAMQRMSITLN